MKVALYPGAFKPPTKGHLSVVQRLLSGNYSTAKVDRETGKYEKISDSPKMDQVWILVGDMVKGGPDKSKGTSPEVAVDQDISMKLWEVYLKSAGLTGKVKLYRAGQVRSSVNESEVYSFLPEGVNPVGDVYGLLKDKYIRDQYKGIEFFPVTGFRSDNPEALKDLKRMDYAKNKYPDLKVIAMLDEPQAGEESPSATKLRAAIYARDEKEIAKYAPGDPEDILALFPNTPEGELADSIDEIFSQFLDWDVTDSVEEWTNEGSGGTPIDAVAAIPSKDRAKMGEYLEYYQNLTPPGWDVSMKGMQIIIAMDKYSKGPQSYNNDYDNTPNQPSMDVSESVKSFDFTSFIASIIEYMLDQGMNILPLPDIKLREDQAEASDVFGKTAYYNPTTKEIILYTLNRHPKDVLRSFCHEMIHHIQNLEGRIGNITTTDTTEDAHLNNIEAEANLKGTMTFRNWTDSVVNETTVEENSTTVNEGRYDTLANQLSKIAFESFKDIHDRGDKKGKFSFRVDHPDDEHDIPSEEFYFDFEGKVEITDDEYKVDGGANAGFDDKGNEITPLLSVKFKIPKNPDWQKVSFDIKDVVRHELEHLTQDGDNEKGGAWHEDPKLRRPSKYMEDDQLIRDLIDANFLPKSQYYKLEKEVDAMLQGLYYKAKKSKRPFKDVVNEYLDIFVDQETISPQEKENILNIWRKRNKSLNLPKF